MTEVLTLEILKKAIEIMKQPLIFKPWLLEREWEEVRNILNLTEEQMLEAYDKIPKVYIE